MTTVPEGPMKTQTRRRDTVVVVVGSANHDQIIRVPRLPQSGETILGESIVTHVGGKGANQAVASARMGSPVHFVGCVGDDPSGALLLRELRAEGVDASHVDIIAGESTGLAIVHVVADGENSITVVPGANFAQTVERVRGAIEELAQDGDLVVVQGELRPHIIAETIAAGTAVGARVLCNLAPYVDLAADSFAACDPLVVNESEASSLVGSPVKTVGDAARAADAILARGARSVAVTLGALGAYWADRGGAGHVIAPPVEYVIDTTGAGDAFVGAVASRLAHGESLSVAVEYGVRAGAFAVTRLGAQTSYPVLDDLADR